MEISSMKRYKKSSIALSLCIAGWLIQLLPAQAASFDCKKAQTRTEHMICDPSSPYGFIDSQDDELNIAYQWAVMRVNDKQKLINEQRRWLKDIRNTCADRACLAKVYRERLETLAALVQTPGCYTLQPIKEGKKVRPIEPVCEVMEKNLNRFCDQPPMACGLKIAPEYRQQIILPNWIPLNTEANRGLIEEFMRAPWQDAGIPQQDKDVLWEEERPKIEQAFFEKRLSFSTAQLDLYNLGKPQTAYRLDYGDCQTNNPQFTDREQWGKAIQPAPVKTHYNPKIALALFQQYFSVQREALREILVFNGKTYDFVMGGNNSNLEESPAENRFVVNRHELRNYSSTKNPSLDVENICIFNYKPLGASK
jgi:uncharacterized protein